MKALSTLRRVRVVLYVLTAGCLAVLALRYETIRLPEEGCSPLVQFTPGKRLLLDRWRGPKAGDAVLFHSGTDLLLGRVQAPPDDLPEKLPSSWSAFDDQHLWIVGDAPDCPALDSRTLGPIDRSDVAAVVAAGLPW